MAIDFKNPHTFDPHLQESMFSGPVPGESWTKEYKSMPFQQPPKHTDLEDTMVHLMHQLLEPEHLKQLLQMMDGGMSIEAICRTILFVGFSSGQFTPDLGMLLYKPLMMSLIAIAHKAGMKDVPVVMKESLDNHMMDRMRRHTMVKGMKGEEIGFLPKVQSQAIAATLVNENNADQQGGFMQRGQQ